MSCVSSCLKACSFAVFILGILIYFNWSYLFLGYSGRNFYEFTENIFYFYEGLWGSAPLILTGFIGISTAFCSNRCIRISLILFSLLTIPCLCSLYIFLVTHFEKTVDNHNCFDLGYNGDSVTMSFCLTSYIECFPQISRNCKAEFEKCLHSTSDYDHFDCGGLRVYSVIQMMVVSLALVTDIFLVIFAVLHHKGLDSRCCNLTGSTKTEGIVHHQPTVNQNLNLSHNHMSTGATNLAFDQEN